MHRVQALLPHPFHNLFGFDVAGVFLPRRVNIRYQRDVCFRGTGEVIRE